jgi:hypothetical protein
MILKLFALQKSLFIASRVAGNVVDSKWTTVWNIPEIGANCGIWDVGWCPVWNEVWNKAWGQKKSGKSLDKIVDSIHSSVINNYDKIISEIDNSHSLISESRFSNIDYSQVMRKLIAFDKSLESLNNRFLLFYLFRVHEILALLQNEEVMKEFDTLVYTLGIFNEYSNLFKSRIKLNELRQLVDIPINLVSIIHDYSDLSIYDRFDVSIVATSFNKKKKNLGCIIV